MKYASEIRQVQCGQREIEYKLTRKSVKNINLRIKPDGKVYVSANNRVPTDYIDNFVKEKQDFIIAALNDYKEKQKDSLILAKEYVDGETFKVLARDLKLKVIEDIRESVTSDETNLILRIKIKNINDKKHKEALINKWIRELVIETFQELCDEAFLVFKKYGVEYPTIKIRDMTSRWGSCRPRKGSITLNSRLIEAPRKSIEYVVFHEFAHFIHPNHSKDFYDFMTLLMPDWKKRKEELKKIL